MDGNRAIKLLFRYRKVLVGTLFFVLALVIYWKEVASQARHFPAKRYLTVKRTIPGGTPVYLPDLSADLAEKPTIMGQLTDQDLAWLQGAQFRNSVAAGSPLRWEDLLLSSRLVGVSSHLSHGFRALEIAIQGMPILRNGDFLDLYQQSGLVAEAVRLIDRDAREGRVTVAVSSDKLGEIQTASERGPFQIVVRPVAEEGQSKAIRWRKKGKYKPTAIPVIED